MKNADEDLRSLGEFIMKTVTKHCAVVFPFLLLALIGCADKKDSKTAKDQQNTSDAINKNEESKLVANSLQCKPIDKSQKIDKTVYWLDTDSAAFEEEYVGISFSKVNARGLCVTSADLFKERKNLPKFFLFFGNHDGLEKISQEVVDIFQKFGHIASLLGRSVCVVEGSKKFLNLVADREDVEFVSWVGHGTDGNLVEYASKDLIHPDEIGKFKSKILRQVNLISCKAGVKQTLWQERFGKGVNIKLSAENIPVIEGLVHLAFDVAEDQIGKCRYLGEQ